MGLNPHECLAFEDSHNGLISANKAGLQTLITINDYTQDQDFSGAMVVLDHMGDPGLPFTVLAGEVGWTIYLDMDLVQHLHRKHVR
jgi:hypothetical protein